MFSLAAVASVRRSLSDLPSRVVARARSVTRADLLRALPGVLLLAATWTLYGLLVRPLAYAGPSLDEKYFIWEGWSLNHGLSPYRDFTDFKPPIVFVCNAIALKVFGLTNQGYRSFFDLLAGAAITALVVALLTRRVGKLGIFALVVVVHLLWLDPHFHDSSLDDSESIGMSFYLLGAAALLVEWRAKRLSDFLGGVLLSLAVLSKEPFMFMAVPTWVALLLWPLGDGQEHARERISRYAKMSLSGVATVAIWLLAYMIAKHSLRDYLGAMRVYLPFAKNICVTYGLWKPAGFWADWAERWNRLTGSLVNFGRMGATLPLVIAAATFGFGRRRSWLPSLAAWGAAAGGLYAVTLGGCFFEHYFMLGMAGFFFLMAVGLVQLSGTYWTLNRQWRLFIGLALLLVPAWQLWPRLSAELGAHYTASTPPLEAPDVVQFIKQNSAPADTVFSTGWPGIYVDSGRRHAVKEDTFFDAFIDLYPGSTDEERLRPIYDELVKSRPKVIYIEPFLEYKRVRHMNALVLPFINAFGYKKINDHLYLRPN